MEEVLPPQAVSHCAKLTRNNLGLFDLEITDADGEILESVRNVSFLLAASIIEGSMYRNGGRKK